MRYISDSPLILKVWYLKLLETITNSIELRKGYRRLLIHYLVLIQCKTRIWSKCLRFVCTRLFVSFRVLFPHPLPHPSCHLIALHIASWTKVGWTWLKLAGWEAKYRKICIYILENTELTCFCINQHRATPCHVLYFIRNMCLLYFFFLTYSIC